MIVAMKVIEANEVKGSKNLRVYRFNSGGEDSLTVVANLTNVYEVGDIVAVATVGTILSQFDGLEILKRKVFGIESSGMALGLAPEGTEVGTQLSDNFGV